MKYQNEGVNQKIKKVQYKISKHFKNHKEKLTHCLTITSKLYMSLNIKRNLERDVLQTQPWDSKY